MNADLSTQLARFPRERTWLVPRGAAAQHVLGHLSDDTLARMSAHLRVPASEALQDAYLATAQEIARAPNLFRRGPCPPGSRAHLVDARTVGSR